MTRTVFCMVWFDECAMHLGGVFSTKEKADAFCKTAPDYVSTEVRELVVDGHDPETQEREVYEMLKKKFEGK